MEGVVSEALLVPENKRVSAGRPTVSERAPTTATTTTADTTSTRTFRRFTRHRARRVPTSFLVPRLGAQPQYRAVPHFTGIEGLYTFEPLLDPTERGGPVDVVVPPARH